MLKAKSGAERKPKTTIPLYVYLGLSKVQFCPNFNIFGAFLHFNDFYFKNIYQLVLVKS